MFELPFHLVGYREQPDVGAVVHAHPTMAIACSLAGISLADGVIPEVITSLGAIPTVPMRRRALMRQLRLLGRRFVSSMPSF